MRCATDGLTAELAASLMADVFISYSHSNRDLARAIADRLTAAGASVWWDRELLAGQDFDAMILRELTAAACVIVIWTENSISSRYVRDEASVAAQRGKLVPVAFEGVDPPLGFRTLHLLRLGHAGAEDDEFVRSLRRAVEERIQRTLKPQLSTNESAESASSPDTALPAQLMLPLVDAYSTLAVTVDCVWLGKNDLIEVRELRSGGILGRTTTAADALFPLPIGDEVVCVGSGMGYQGPDTVSVERWKLRGAIEDVRGENRKAEDYIPGPWESSRDTVVASVRRESILQAGRLVTWAWQPGPVDLSDDGDQIAVVVDVPENRIQIWSVARPDEPAISVPLGNCHPDEILLLQDGTELVTVERGKADGLSCVSLWNVAIGQRVAKHDFDYMTVNVLCRTGAQRLVALGLDQSVVFLQVNDGTVEAQIELDSRPVQSCAFDPQCNRLGLLTSEELVVIDLATMRTWKTLKHLGTNGLDCDLRGQVMAALVTARDDKTKLVLWDLAS